MTDMTDMLEQENMTELDSGSECVICMTNRKDTTVLPCRHMCMCSECADALRHRTNKCPICRNPIESLLHIKMQNRGQAQADGAAGDILEPSRSDGGQADAPSRPDHPSK